MYDDVSNSKKNRKTHTKMKVIQQNDGDGNGDAKRILNNAEQEQN